MMLREVWAGKFDFKHTHHSARLPLIARSLLRASLPALQRKLAGSRSDISFFLAVLAASADVGKQRSRDRACRPLNSLPL